MKNIVIVIILLLSSVPGHVSAHNEQHLVALGDSIPFGYHLSKDEKKPSQYAFPFIIGRKKGLEVRNIAVPGMTSKQLYEAVLTDKSYRESIKDADYVIVYIGGNDLLNVVKRNGGIQGIEIKEVIPVLRDWMYHLFSTILEIDKLTEGKILVYNIYNPYPDADQQLETVLYYINQQLASLVKLMSHFTDIELIDAHKAFRGHPDYILKGDVHPSKKGQTVLAKKALRYIH
ncbi:GDSL-type esterase/lipase family protein [Halobacillus yeomjeoni]|uniref:SGNH/GDSL hydrolase family protein n=1 Tax=Halobacillus yeomjeoni TaxID=311194 RepID=A0A931HVX4_9BACI|nr:GDSL-type esterase/lipase family protein [Halobacillus yeomjeoni]MBH0230373.1 SGNH/GDSL hydrolase family protein [Halobacillus yeomjeoni]